MSNLEKLNRFQSFLLADPNNLALIAETADLALECGQTDQAYSLAKQGYSLDASRKDLRHTMAVSLMHLGQVSEAAKMFQSILDDGEQHPSIRYNLAYCYGLTGDFELALSYLNDAEQQYAQLPAMLHLKITTMHHLAQVDEAIELATKVLATNKEDGILHGLLSTLYIDAEAFELAEAHASEALRLGTKTTDALATMGLIFLSQQQNLTALGYFNEATKLKKNNSRAWLGKGLAELSAGSLIEAEMSLNHTLELMPKHLGTWQVLAWCQLAQKNIAAAEETVKKALAIDDTFAESHGLLAIIQIILNQIPLAKDSIKRSLGLNSTSFSGLYARALLLQHEGNPEKASKLIDGLLDTKLFNDKISLRQIISK